MKAATRNGKAKTKNGTCSVQEPKIVTVAIADIKPAVINDVVYGAIHPDDERLNDLLRSLPSEGQLEPIVLTLDNVILSGHRRRAAALVLGWETLKARYYPITSLDPQFEKILVAFNAQRDQSPDTRVREQLVLADPATAYEELTSQRAEASRVRAETLKLGVSRKRSKISAARQPFLQAIQRVVEDLKNYWPLSDRRVHYALLNNPPLIHASKPESRYRNDHKTYKKTCDLLTRARLAGLIPFNAIGNETRPVTTWDVHQNVSPFVRRGGRFLLRLLAGPDAGSA